MLDGRKTSQCNELNFVNSRIYIKRNKINGKNKVEKVMKKLCVCTLSVVIGMLSIQIMPVSAASKTGMGKITNKINKAGYNLWGGYDSPEEAATYDIDFYDSGINAGVAVGGNISLKYNDSYDYGDNLKYNWQIVNGNDHIAMEVSADQKTARITGRSIGDATVRLNIITDEGTEYQSIETKEMHIQISNPRLKNNKLATVLYNEGKVEVEGNSTNGQERIIYRADNNHNFYVSDDGTFYGYAKQTRKIYVYVDGICLEATVKCTDPQYRASCILKKGQKVSYKVSGASGYTPVTYKVGNTKYASVSSNGLTKGKKYGRTTLTISADNASVSFNIYILKSKVYKGVSKAQAICKTKPRYSQAKRMRKDYVDCSSFVWKSYKPYGVNFGSKSYAPTAADIAKWCGKKKKLLKLSTYNGKSDRLLPGDLIFYRKRSGKNGRYKNIDHIAMYVGNDTIVHADGSSVSYSYPWYRKVAAIARPVK